MGTKAPRAPRSAGGMLDTVGLTPAPCQVGSTRLGDPPPLRHGGSPPPGPREVRGREGCDLERLPPVPRARQCLSPVVGTSRYQAR